VGTRLRSLSLGRQTLLKKYFAHKQIRFLAVGGVNFAWGLASYPALYLLLLPFGFNYVIILVITYILNTLISFFSQKYLVFRTKGDHLHELLKFSGLQGIVLAINLVVLPTMVTLTQLNPMLVQTAFALTLLVVSYVFHDRVTFYRRKHRTTDEMPVGTEETKR
jgi:putative flippase GtrA